MKKFIFLVFSLIFLSGSSSISLTAKIPYTVEFIVEEESYLLELYHEDLKSIYEIRPYHNQDYFDGWYYDLHYEKPFSYLNNHNDHFTLYAKFKKEKPYEIVNTAT